MSGQGMQRRDKRSPVGSPSQSDMAGLRADDQDFVFSSPSVPLTLQGSSWCLLILSVGSNTMRLHPLHASASICFSSLVSSGFSSSHPSLNNLTSGCWTRPSKRRPAPLDTKFACSGRPCGILFCLLVVGPPDVISHLYQMRL